MITIIMTLIDNNDYDYDVFASICQANMYIEIPDSMLQTTTGYRIECWI